MAPELNLLQQLTPESRVLLWAHQGPLNLQTPGIASMDYLLDGLVTGHLSSLENKPLQDVVFSHLQYGVPFWVAFVNVAEVTPKTYLAGLQELLPDEALKQAIVYSQEPLPAAWEKSLRGVFNDLKILQ